MNEGQIKYKEITEQCIHNANEIIAILNDMATAIINNYDVNKIYLFRELCLGYLLICKSNIEATVRLIENNLVHQIHYTSRNMFEMVLTLYYIDDDIHKKNERVSRFYEYNDSIKRNQSRQIILKYPEIFGELRGKNVEKEIDYKVKEFKEKYKNKEGKKVNDRTWSGLTMPQMIEAITDSSLKTQLTKEYDIMTAMNNNFLHPTKQYLKIVFKEFYSQEINYKDQVMHMSSVLSMSYMIIDKCLSQFSKGRPVFREQLSKVFDKIATQLYEEKG